MTGLLENSKVREGDALGLPGFILRGAMSGGTVGSDPAA
jgi:hypothetical protein